MAWTTLQLFTTQVFVLFLVYCAGGLSQTPWLVELLRAAYMWVAAITTLYLFHRGLERQRRMYERLFPALKALPPETTWAWELLVHYVPVAVLGTARAPWAYGAAFGWIVFWYLCVARGRMEELYGPDFGVSTDVLDRALASAGVAVGLSSVYVKFFCSSKALR